MVDFSFDVNKFADSLRPAVEKLAQSLGTATNALLDAGIRHELAVGIFDAIAAVIIGVMLVVDVRVLLKHKYRHTCTGSYCDGCWGTVGFYVMFGIAFLVGSVVFFSSLYDATTHLVSPQWALATDLIKMIKGN